MTPFSSGQSGAFPWSHPVSTSQTPHMHTGRSRHSDRERAPGGLRPALTCNRAPTSSAPKCAGSLCMPRIKICCSSCPAA
eukprot:4936739-Prymnesium_polylepis.1